MTREIQTITVHSVCFSGTFNRTSGFTVFVMTSEQIQSVEEHHEIQWKAPETSLIVDLALALFCF